MSNHMMLRKFECRGFKGFKDWISFDLQASDYPLKKGIIKNGVVNKALIYGRNGSGKSNISDAVRWVLGEQSVKTLRCSRMEDVIFSEDGRGLFPLYLSDRRSRTDLRVCKEESRLPCL